MRRSIAALALAVVLPASALVPGAAHANVIVQPGETLSEIADRYGISLERLMQANGIRNANVVVAGTRLVIPGRRTAAAGPSGAGVTVRQGETLSEIADRNGVSLTRLMQANGISDPSFIQAGQRLVIPGRATAAASLRRSPSTPTTSTTIKSGETLSDIAARTGTSVERLMQLNGISNPDMVAAGTRLTVPGKARSTALATANRKASHHVVQSGETLSHIADAYDVPVERLISLNKIDDPNLVVAGTRLQLQPPPPIAKPKPKAVARQPKPTAPRVAKATAKPKPTVVAAKPAATAPVPAAAKAPATALTATTTSETATNTASPTAAATPVVRTTPVATSAPVKTTESVVPSRTQVKAEPVAKAEPVVKTEPVVKAETAAKPKPAIAAEPAAKTDSTVGANAKRSETPAEQATPKTPIRSTTAVAPTRSAPVQQAEVAANRVKPTPQATATANSGRKPVGPDWRSYGPMQVDWANWRPMGGSFVAPSLGSDGKPHYLAINCGARKLNATSQSGQWKTWDNPQNDDEQRLVSDLCTSKGG